MIKSISRTLVRQSLPKFYVAPRAQRFLSIAPPPQKSRSWKNSAVRWGIAVGGLYYYNNSNVFADEPAYSIPPSPSIDDTPLPTLDSVSASRQQSKLARPPATPSPPASSMQTTTSPNPLEETEEEASQQGAFNEETGEINWDCPCLGGMAHGPCGEHFRAAFSCFVFSKDEPKGMDCIEHFKTMQGCFREHPDVYGDEMASDEDDIEREIGQESEGLGGPDLATPGGDTAATSAMGETKPSSRASTMEAENPHDQAGRTERAKAATEQVARDHGAQSESDAMVPKAAHDATAPTTEE